MNFKRRLFQAGSTVTVQQMSSALSISIIVITIGMIHGSSTYTGSRDFTAKFIKRHDVARD
jgi:hypothetical protein